MMTVHDTIPIEPDDMPYNRQVDLDSGSYIFGFQWNEIDRTFTIDVSTLDGVAIRQGEVLVLNQPLWRNINIDGLPAETIIPLDESENEIEIDPGNLGDTVNLCIDDIPDGEV